MTKNLKFVKMNHDHLPDVVEAFRESFDALRLFYSPAWSKMDKLPGDKELHDMVAGWIDVADQPEGITYLCYNDDADLVGFGEFHHIDWSVPKGRIGYWVRNGFEGLGIATQIARELTKMAFEDMGFERLEIRSEIRNPASRRIAEKLGYDHIGVFKKNKRVGNNEFWDLDVFARLNASNL